MPGCVWDPQHDCKWLPWPHMYPVGHGGAELCHPVSRTHNQHLCTGYQWTHCKSTFQISFFVILYVLPSRNLPFLPFFCSLSFLAHCCHVVPLQSAHSTRKLGFSLLTACISSLCVFCFFVCIFCAHGRQHHITLSKGEIASCAGPLLYLWTMKGQLLSCTDTSCGPQADVLCVGFTQRHEWDAKNVVVTGCADGIIRVSFMYVCNNVIVTVCMR